MQTVAVVSIALLISVASSLPNFLTNNIEGYTLPNNETIYIINAPMLANSGSRNIVDTNVLLYAIVGARANEVIEKIMGFPRVLGAVDGCHIQIRAPQEKYHPMSYLNRKRDYSVILQAVCDHTLRFTDILSGWPGSVHDARVFKNSPLYEASCSENLFPGDTHIVGDAAYPLQSWVLTPYKDTGNLAECQKRYNFIHANTRQTIERAFGLLKGKWRRLRFLEMTKLEDVPSVITAACTLHNMCIENNENDLDMCSDTSIFADAPAVSEPLNQSGSVKRNALAQYFWSTNRY
ncbi:uncharacterized protein LOC133205004 [Saccostrea echinata]|uniref:uncharacterized protein LOC133205004 n=1 Tax=Saccostrea echinata TaxID=191078 RepID=UPI002A824E89|nr:uncharacterized protein LOC133205004 [Saccostrea echinata]